MNKYLDKLDLVYLVLLLWEIIIGFLYIVQMANGAIEAWIGLTVILCIGVVMYGTLWWVFCRDRNVEDNDDEE